MNELEQLKDTIQRYKDNATQAFQYAGREDKQDWERGQVQAFNLVLREINEQLGVEEDE